VTAGQVTKLAHKKQKQTVAAPTGVHGGMTLHLRLVSPLWPPIWVSQIWSKVQSMP